jgi:hypothetical protein
MPVTIHLAQKTRNKHLFFFGQNTEHVQYWIVSCACMLIYLTKTADSPNLWLCQLIFTNKKHVASSLKTNLVAKGSSFQILHISRKIHNKVCKI